MSRDYVRFVITGDARTGSNMLVHALNTNPAIRCFREVFHYWMDRVDYFVEGYDSQSREDLELRQSDPVRFLQERIFCDQPVEFKAVGFKYLYGHFWGFDALTAQLQADPDLRIVHLKRRNWLRVLVSVKLAEASGRWIEDRAAGANQRPLLRRLPSAIVHPSRTIARLRRRTEDQRQRVAEKAGLRLTRDECLNWFTRTRREIALGDTLTVGHLTLDLYYEDVLEERQAAFERVQLFLGVPPRNLSVALKRQNPERLSDLIANYDELRAAFAGTEYEGFFDE